jgi:hypothetical protein
VGLGDWNTLVPCYQSDRCLDSARLKVWLLATSQVIRSKMLN